MSIYTRVAPKDWGLDLGPIRFMRFMGGKPKFTQLVVGPLWITKHGTKLTVNMKHWMLFHGDVMVNRRTSEAF